MGGTARAAGYRHPLDRNHSEITHHFLAFRPFYMPQTFKNSATEAAAASLSHSTAEEMNLEADDDNAAGDSNYGGN